MCIRTHSHGSNRYDYGVMYRVSEFFFSNYYYYEISDMNGVFISNISEIFFNKEFVVIDKCYEEVNKMFNEFIDGDVVII